jgi:hypothetical protein
MMDASAVQNVTVQKRPPAERKAASGEAFLRELWPSAWMNEEPGEAARAWAVKG